MPAGSTLHMLNAAPSRHGQRLNSSAPRAGVHIGEAANAFVKRTPSCARRSKAGVLTFWPVALAAWPQSSTIASRMLGRRASVCERRPPPASMRGDEPCRYSRETARRDAGGWRRVLFAAFQRRQPAWRSMNEGAVLARCGETRQTGQYSGLQTRRINTARWTSQTAMAERQTRATTLRLHVFTTPHYCSWPLWPPTSAHARSSRPCTPFAIKQPAQADGGF